jgi:serine protease Do
VKTSFGWRTAQIALFAFLLVGASRAARADGTRLGEAGRPAIGFSNLVVRLDNDPDIGIAGDELRIHILEALRGAGYNAVGAESLVFGKDHAERADFLLGGTVRDLKCFETDVLRCRIGVEWQLLDVRRDAIVYTVTTRHLTVGGSRREPKVLAKALVVGAVNAVGRRARFKEALATGAETPRAQASGYAPAGYKECKSAGLEMPAAAEDVLRATVLVRVGDGFGSGFLLSPDGYVLTAAHVVDRAGVTVRMHDGTTQTAIVVRIAKDVDAALLRLPEAHATPCLALDLEPKKVGNETYAIGSPASEKLAFSLTRGIISGVRNLDGVEFLQTDAAVSPGNSGGPLVDTHGRATAIVSWKISGVSVQGVAFGVPVGAALRGLGLAPAAETDPQLATTAPAAASSGRAQPEADVTDPMPAIDPLGDAQRDLEAREAARDRNIPKYLYVLRWGGVALAGIGAYGAYASNNSYDDKTSSQPEYKKQRLYNDLGWAGMIVGTGMFVTSYALVPSVKPARVGVAFAPDGRVEVRGAF